MTSSSGGAPAAAGVWGRRGLVTVLVLLGVAAVALLAVGGEPVAKGAGLFCLAAVGGVLATRRVGRRLVGLAVLLVGGLTAVAADGVLARVAGALMAVVGVLVVRFGPGWSGLPQRYEGSDAGDGRPGDRAAAARPHDLWDAMDRGEDPTA